MVDDLLHKEIIERMKEYQSQLDYDTMGTEVLLLALMSIEDSMTNLILKELNVTINDVLNYINDFYFLRETYNYTYTLLNVFEKTKDLQKNKDFVYDEAYLYSILESEDCVALEILSRLEIEGKQIADELLNALSYLEEDERLLINLTQKARNKELNKLIGRKEIINSIDNVLSKKQKNNCILIGPAGVGKSGIVEGLAYHYLKQKKEYTIYQLDIGSLLAGTKYRGDLEEKLMDTIESIKGKNNILFIDEIHNIINNNSSESSIDIANLLKPYLARSNIKCIGATTIEEYHKTIVKDKALARRFKNIIVNEPTKNEMINILNGIKKDYESFYKIKYDEIILKKIIQSSYYYHSLNNPDKSIDIMDECGINTVKKKQKKVTISILKQVIFDGLSIDLKKAKFFLKNSNLDKKIKKQLYDYFDLKYNKYICCINVTNNNKKEIIKQLSKIFNLSNEGILEIDVNDFDNTYTLSTLLGTSPGYIGYEDGGIISKHVIRNNISMIIFNNYKKDNSLINKKIIEKILNNGYLIDYQGSKIKFINTIIMLKEEKEKRIGYF